MFGRPKSKQVEFKVSNRADAPVRYTLGDHAFLLPPGVTRTHQQCSPPELRFETLKVGGAQAAGRVGREPLRPNDGTHYVVERADSPAAGLAVREQ